MKKLKKKKQEECPYAPQEIICWFSPINPLQATEIALATDLMSNSKSISRDVNKLEIMFISSFVYCSGVIK